jgi:hypothetical protein
MTDADWKDDSALSLGIYLDGSDSPDRAGDGSLLLDDDFYLMVNGYWEPLTFTIPSVRTPPGGAAESWRVEISTYDGNPSPGDRTTPSGGGTTPSGDASTPPAPGHGHRRWPPRRRFPLPHCLPRPRQLSHPRT